MYHCHTCYYMITCQDELFTVLQQIPPLPHFTHEYLSGDSLDVALAGQADVILADIRQTQTKEMVASLIACKRQTANLILLVDKEQAESLTLKNDMNITDIWIMPLSESEFRFRLIRWQTTYKMSKDFWKTQNYLNATINCVPHLIWYKDKEGAHIKVNEAFCKAVNKSMEQIEGRGH